MKSFRASDFAYVGLVVLGTAVVFSATGYHGLSGDEDYSPTNHFVSELGNRFKCSLFYIHNAGMITGGTFLLFATTSMRSALKTYWPLLALSSSGIIGIGLFPETANIAIHLLAAILVFVGSGGGVAVVLFKAVKGDFVRPLKTQIVVMSGITASCLVCLALLPKQLLADAIKLQHAFVRPAVWWLAITEWAFVLSYVVWFALIVRSVRLHSTSTDDRHR